MLQPSDLLTCCKRRLSVAVAALLLGTAGIASAQTVRVQAEDYVAFGTGGALSNMGGSNGLGVETRDAVGKDGEHVTGSFLTYFRNIGNNSLQEYLEYKVTAPSAGMYTVRVRAAYLTGSATIRAWNLTNGATFDNVVDVTPSAGMAAEHMIQFDLTYPMPLLEGDNRVRFYMINRGLNPDWFEFVRTGDIVDYGLVKGKITDLDTDQPVGPAMVNTSLLDTGLPGVPLDYGFRSVSDSAGNYQLMLPISVASYGLKVGAQGYSDPAGTVASVTIADTSTITQDLEAFATGRYEAEWFSNAATSGIPNGKGLGMFDRPAGGTSFGRVVGTWESYADWIEYTVTAPADGLYEFAFYMSPNTDAHVRMTTSTGYENRMAIVKGVGYQPYAFSSVPLRAGANTVRMTNLGTISTNIDYFTVSASSGAFGTISGTVTNSATSAPEAGATVTVTEGFGTVVARAVTDATGAYTVLAAPSDYTVTASKSGFDGGAGTNVSASAGGTTTTNLSLAPSDTIVVLPEQITDIKNGSSQIPRIYSPYTGSPTGQTLGSYEADSWAEFPVYAAKPGLYNITFDHASLGAGRVVVVDVRAEGSDQHYATPDIALPDTFAWNTFTVTSSPETVPLQAGVNILRLHNLTTLHDLARTAANAGGSVNIARITLNRTADLPASAPLTGTVTSAGFGPVPDAMVLANKPGSEVPEPSRFWFQGYWTTTGADGTYELDVPASAYTVQAARPDNFVLAGARAENVVVTGTGASANLDLTSRWSDSSIRVEAEYYVAKVPEELGDSSGPGIPLYVSPDASNGYKLMPGSEDWVDLAVDVPASGAGSYNLTLVYYNPLVNPANAGSTPLYTMVNNNELMVEALPITPSLVDRPAPSEFTFAQTVALQPGRNIVRLMPMAPANTAPAFDAIVLTRAQVLAMARQALSIAGGLSASTADDLTALNVVTTGDSATVIDLLDALELAGEGK